MRRFLAALIVLVALPLLAPAKVVTETVLYREGDTELEGFVAYDDATPDKRPGVLIVHQWMGLTEYEKGRAKMLAEQGYVAFAADIYGKGVRPADTKEAGAQAGKYKGDRKLYRARLNAGLAELKKNARTDAAKTAAIGYCFGGTGVLELARSGADVNAVVSFHGGLDSPTPADGANIKASVLVLHGAADPFVPEADIKAFVQEMETNKVDWQMVSYGHAVHSFTEKDADKRGIKGAGYNEHADKRSWKAMQVFLGEVFGKK